LQPWRQASPSVSRPGSDTPGPPNAARSRSNRAPAFRGSRHPARRCASCPRRVRRVMRPRSMGRSQGELGCTAPAMRPRLVHPRRCPHEAGLPAIAAAAVSTPASRRSPLLPGPLVRPDAVSAPLRRLWIARGIGPYCACGDSVPGDGCPVARGTVPTCHQLPPERRASRRAGGSLRPGGPIRRSRDHRDQDGGARRSWGAGRAGPMAFPFARRRDRPSTTATVRTATMGPIIARGPSTSTSAPRRRRPSAARSSRSGARSGTSRHFATC
jgi:hypothetical protein